MALDAEDRARLRRIESGLTRDDPGLARQFRSWRPASGLPPFMPGWSVVPPWVLLVFVVGFSTWMVSPALGVLVAVIAGLGWLLTRAARRMGMPGRAAGSGRVLGGPDQRG